MSAAANHERPGFDSPSPSTGGQRWAALGRFHGWQRIALQAYRLGVLIAIVWIIRAHHIHLRISGDAPITFAEIKAIFPSAETSREDPGERAGIFVYDGTGKQIGYVLRTMPHVEDIIGYRGWTDALVAFDPSLRVVGVQVRGSLDTRDHVRDVKGDPYFLKTWNGKPWDEVARTSPEEAGIEGVSGATMTSMAVAEGITRRLASADAALAARPPSLQFDGRDAGLAVVILAATALAFTGTHGRKWVRRIFQILVIVYVGFLTADLLALSIVVGWAQQGGVPWRTAPALVLLLSAALLVPWATGKPLYCHQICPHGAAQELLNRVAPQRWRINLPKDFASGLRWLPCLLLGFALVISFLVLPIDLAHIEPFDAYALKAAGWATISIAVVGLIASLFVPMAYCHYGCPTGALLSFVRARGTSDRFGKRDLAALLLLGTALLLSAKYHVIYAWILSGD